MSTNENTEPVRCEQRCFDSLEKIEKGVCKECADWFAYWCEVDDSELEWMERFEKEGFDFGENTNEKMANDEE